jgi:hypothetical protein
MIYEAAKALSVTVYFDAIRSSSSGVVFKSWLFFGPPKNFSTKIIVLLCPPVKRGELFSQKGVQPI